MLKYTQGFLNTCNEKFKYLNICGSYLHRAVGCRDEEVDCIVWYCFQKQFLNSW